jgi:gliding motility-associated-like protein
MTVNPSPAVPVVGSITQPTCTIPTGSVILSGLPAGNWTINPGAISGNSLSTTISSLTAGTYNYTVTNASGCTSAASTNVIINPQPSTPAAPVATVTQPTCALTTGSITVTSPAPGAGIGYSIDGVSYANTTGIFTLVPSGAYNLTVQNASGCVSIPTAVIINSQPSVPTVPVVTVTQPTCAISTGTITITAPVPTSGITYSIDGITYTNTTGIFTTVASGAYNVTVKDAGGCISGPTVVTLNAQPTTPLAPVLGTITQPSCAVSTGSVIINGLPAGNWTINPGAISGSSTNTTISGLSSGTYNFTVTNSSGCTSPASANVVFNVQPPVPAVSVASQTNVLCNGNRTGSLTVAGSGGTPPFMYKIGEGSYQSSGTFGTLAAGSYVVTVQDANLCTAIASVSITEPIILGITHTKQDATCLHVADGSITLTLTGGTQPYNVLWSDGTTGSNRQDITSGTYRAIVTDLNGCTASDEIVIEAMGSAHCLEIQEIITPNNDGYYDTWKIKNIEMFPNAEVEVFNRWGKRVFMTKNIPANAWDATFEGKLLPTDSYHYILYLNDGSKPITGVVTIIR